MVRKKRKRRRTKKNTEHWNSKKKYTCMCFKLEVGKVVLTVKVHVWLEEFSLEFKSTL